MLKRSEYVLEKDLCSDFFLHINNASPCCFNCFIQYRKLVTGSEEMDQNSAATVNMPAEEWYDQYKEWYKQQTPSDDDSMVTNPDDAEEFE